MGHEDRPENPCGGPPCSEERNGTVVHPAWRQFMKFCREMGHGEIERLSIQDGLPVLAEMTKKKVKFNR